MNKEYDWFETTKRAGCRRYYRIAGITLQIDADLPIAEHTFMPRFRAFRVDGPGEDTIVIQHHFSLPDLQARELGRLVYRQPPWAVYQADARWTYVGIPPTGTSRPHHVAVFNLDHTRGTIYSPGVEAFCRGNSQSLTLLPSDQLVLARVLAEREGCYLHASGAILEGQGLLFLGYSETGKSTMMRMLKGKAEILCDERIIVRKEQEGLRIHGTWSHGDVPDVSPASAPLRAILFLEQAPENALLPLAAPRERVRRLLACLIKPLVSAGWWEQTLSLVEELARAPCYIQRFDKSGQIVRLLERLV